jgi:putative hydrolase of the HAD superfamily
MALKCVLFDADGVVINSEMFSVQYQQKYGVEGDKMLPFFKGEFQDCLTGEADLAEIVKPWLAKWKWDGSVEEFLQFWFRSEHKVDERVVAAIKELRSRGIKCYLATNQEKHRTQYMKEQMGFGQLFDKVYSSAEIGYRKPTPEFFEFVLDEVKSQHGIKPEEVMFFDDSAENIAAAKGLGINAYQYENYDQFAKLLELATSS